jgi:hypothetical protein
LVTVLICFLVQHHHKIIIISVLEVEGVHVELHVLDELRILFCSENNLVILTIEGWVVRVHRTSAAWCQFHAI